jgi:hypothetical protein
MMKFKVFDPPFDIRHSLFDILRFVFEILRNLPKRSTSKRYFFPDSRACSASCLARCLMISPSMR